MNDDLYNSAKRKAFIGIILYVNSIKMYISMHVYMCVPTNNAYTCTILKGYT